MGSVSVLLLDAKPNHIRTQPWLSRGTSLGGATHCHGWALALFQGCPFQTTAAASYQARFIFCTKSNRKNNSYLPVHMECNKERLRINAKLDIEKIAVLVFFVAGHMWRTLCFNSIKHLISLSFTVTSMVGRSSNLAPSISEPLYSTWYTYLGTCWQGGHQMPPKKIKKISLFSHFDRPRRKRFCTFFFRHRHPNAIVTGRAHCPNHRAGARAIPNLTAVLCREKKVQNQRPRNRINTV